MPDWIEGELQEGAVKKTVGLHYPDAKWSLILSERKSLEVTLGMQLELTVDR